MESTILRSLAVKEIYSGDSFDAEFVTADRKRGTGGDLIRVEGWRILAPEDDPEPSGRAAALAAVADIRTADPNHKENGTVNIYNPANKSQHPISVHVDLIQTFNGKIVTNG